MSDLWSNLRRVLTRTELWVMVATILGVLIKSDVFDAESGMFKVISLALAVLAALGYTAGRSYVKGKRASAIGEAAKAAPVANP